MERRAFKAERNIGLSATIPQRACKVAGSSFRLLPPLRDQAPAHAPARRLAPASFARPRQVPSKRGSELSPIPERGTSRGLVGGGPQSSATPLSLRPKLGSDPTREIGVLQSFALVFLAADR
jgi:hypothetical protein